MWSQRVRSAARVSVACAARALANRSRATLAAFSNSDRPIDPSPSISASRSSRCLARDSSATAWSSPASGSLLSAWASGAFRAAVRPPPRSAHPRCSSRSRCLRKQRGRLGYACSCTDHRMALIRPSSAGRTDDKRVAATADTSRAVRCCLRFGSSRIARTVFVCSAVTIAGHCAGPRISPRVSTCPLSRALRIIWRTDDTCHSPFPVTVGTCSSFNHRVSPTRPWPAMKHFDGFSDNRRFACANRHSVPLVSEGALTSVVQPLTGALTHRSGDALGLVFALVAGSDSEHARNHSTASVCSDRHSRSGSCR